MCCSTAAWQREDVPDHKFDFIDVRDYRLTNCSTKLSYVWFYVLTIKSFLVYISDFYTAIAMLISNHWSGSILQSSSTSKDDVVQVPFTVGKWIFSGAILISFLLLAWEGRKAKAIIRSRDISYAYTNVMANNYYSLKSYDYFCFFSQINNSKKKKDEFAFFVFFTFKGWKRLIFADAPRQVINGLTLYSFGKSQNFTTNISAYYGSNLVKDGVLTTMLFTVTVFAGSAILLAIAVILYIPLLCYIRGNLKEYCCHKIDKRIAELVKRKAQRRRIKQAQLAKKEAAGDFSHYKDKNGNMKGVPLPQPTLPNVDLDGFDDAKSEVVFGANGGGYGNNLSYNKGWGHGSNRGSISGMSMAGYPPGYSSAGGSQVGVNNWGGKFAGYHHAHHGSGSVVGVGYPGYAASEVASVVDSQEPLTMHPQQVPRSPVHRSPSRGGELSVDYGASNLGYANGGGLEAPRDELGRAPSYKSDWAQQGAVGSGGEKELNVAYGEMMNGGGYQQQQQYNPNPPPSSYYPYDSPQSNLHSSPSLSQRQDYQPPSRSKLYDKSGGEEVRDSATSDGNEGFWRESGSQVGHGNGNSRGGEEWARGYDMGGGGGEQVGGGGYYQAQGQGGYAQQGYGYDQGYQQQHQQQQQWQGQGGGYWSQGERQGYR